MSTLREEFLFRIRTALAYGRGLAKTGEPVPEGWAAHEAEAAVERLNPTVARLFADIAQPECPACGSLARYVRVHVDRKPCQDPWHGPTSDEVGEAVRAFFDVHRQPSHAWSPDGEAAFRAGVAWMFDRMARSVEDAS